MTQVNKPTGLIGAIRGCASWQDIQNKWRNFPEKQKGDFFEELAKAYIQLEPEYANKLKHVWLQREVPQAIARKLKLPASDRNVQDGTGRQRRATGSADTDAARRRRETGICALPGKPHGYCGRKFPPARRCLSCRDVRGCRARDGLRRGFPC